MLAHIRNGQLIRQFASSKGRAYFEDGRTISPIVEGTYGNDKIVPMVQETQDTSTGTVPTVRTDTGWQVEADRVYRLVAIRDMTAQEIDDRQTQQATSEAQRVLGDIQRRGLNVLFDLINQFLVSQGQPALTLQQYVNLLNGPKGDGPITVAQYINYVKNKLP